MLSSTIILTYFFNHKVLCLCSFLYTFAYQSFSARIFSRFSFKAIADFNEKADIFPNATDVWEAEFFEAEGDYPGTKLMGVPNGWPSWESAPQLLLQFNAKDAPGVTGLPGDEGIGWMFFVGSMEKPEESCWFSKTM